MAWRIGVDSGGTFTDICLFDEKSGQIAVWKVPSTPADPSHAVHGVLYPRRCRPAECARRRSDAISDAVERWRDRVRGGGAAPVRTVLSGPSTGVVGAQVIARLAGAHDIITFDMGGTSTDVALMQGAEPTLAREAVVHGYPIKAPMLDIHTVGAGGGSIAFVDSSGLLKVGPKSAGADPGPACYDRGNKEPTVTDANVVLGTLNPTHLLGGRMHVRQDLARAAINRLAARLGIEALSAAEGIIAVVTANMARAIRVISVQRGHDPRDYTLVAFGGAGPLHAARLAAELDIRRVLVPRNPGILCAMGLLLADLRTDFAATRLLPLSSSVISEAERIIAELRRRCAAWFAGAGIKADARRVVLSVDMRYAGQNYELSVPLPEGPVTPTTIDRLGAGFAAAHQRLYGFVAEDEPMQLVTFRAEATGIVRKADVRPSADTGPDPREAVYGRREVWLRETGAFVSCPLYDRAQLGAGNHIEGPAIVEQMDATTLIVPGATATVDRYFNLLLELP
jgi:N-methylhydantoinase A